MKKPEIKITWTFTVQTICQQPRNSEVEGDSAYYIWMRDDKDVYTSPTTFNYTYFLFRDFSHIKDKRTSHVLNRTVWTNNKAFKSQMRDNPSCDQCSSVRMHPLFTADLGSPWWDSYAILQHRCWWPCGQSRTGATQYQYPSLVSAVAPSRPASQECIPSSLKKSREASILCPASDGHIADSCTCWHCYLQILLLPSKINWHDWVHIGSCPEICLIWARLWSGIHATSISHHRIVTKNPYPVTTYTPKSFPAPMLITHVSRLRPSLS